MPSLAAPRSFLRFPLTQALGSVGSVRVLRMLSAGGSHATGQIARGAGLTPQGVRLVLDNLVAQGLVKVHGSARTQLYELDARHPLATALAALFQTESARWDDLLERLRAELGRQAGVKAAWLYGSVARGVDEAHSDVDIALLVTSAGVADRVREALMPLEDAHHVTFSIAALTPTELAALRDDDPWWSDVARDAQILKGASPQAAMKRLRAGKAAA